MGWDLGVHLPFAQDVDRNAGTDASPDESSHLVHALTTNMHIVNGDQNICSCVNPGPDS